MEAGTQALKVHCRVCGNTAYTTLYRRDEKLAEQPTHAAFSPVAQDFGIYFDILKCATCGLVYAKQDEIPEALAECYAEAEDDGRYQGQHEEREANYRACLRVAEPFLRSPQESKVLDVGAGSGIFLNLLKKQGFRAQGIEPSRDLVERARKEYGLEVECGTVEKLQRPPGSLDMVTMMEVIEHLPTPDLTVEKISSLLKPGGVLLAVTPNIESISARLLGAKWWSFRQMHVFYFSKRTLARLAEKSGLKLVAFAPLWKGFPLDYYLSSLRKRPVKLPGFLNFKLMAPLGDMIAVFVKREDRP